MNPDSKIYIAGHTGLAGSALIPELQHAGYSNIITRNSKELDLRIQQDVRDFFEQEKPEYVFLAAARTGGILVNNTHPADFLRDNLQIQTNVIDSAWRAGTKKLLFFGSSSSYPRDCPQPIKEDYLMTGLLEQSHEAYALAKITGIKMCQTYHKQYGFNAISMMLTNFYGPGDNFNPARSNVMPALIRKFHEAKAKGEKEVIIFGTGKPRREFLFIEDLVSACLFLMQNYNEPDILNVGTGTDVTIRELAETIREITDYQGHLVFDSSKPDGVPRKLLDVSRLEKAGWKSRTTLKEGIKKTYDWFINNL